MEKKWAKNLLAEIEKGEVEEDELISYYDWLYLMLGRKKYTVELYEYDVSKGKAKYYAQPFLGTSFEGIWHTSIVVYWYGEPIYGTEYWFGGRLFQTSPPGSTPFGEPYRKTALGTTYKGPSELLDYIKSLHGEFNRRTYDVLTCNCNHFTNKLSLFLMNESIPDRILEQPEIAMKSMAFRAIKPMLNMWLGGFGEEGGGVEGSSTSDNADAGQEPKLDLTQS